MPKISKKTKATADKVKEDYMRGRALNLFKDLVAEHFEPSDTGSTIINPLVSGFSNHISIEGGIAVIDAVKIGKQLFPGGFTRPSMTSSKTKEQVYVKLLKVQKDIPKRIDMFRMIPKSCKLSMSSEKDPNRLTLLSRLGEETKLIKDRNAFSDWFSAQLTTTVTLSSIFNENLKPKS
eukprot:372393_1